MPDRDAPTIAASPAAHDAASPGLVAVLREDLAASAGITTPGFHAVAVYRLGRWAMGLSGLRRKAWGALYAALSVFVRNVYGIEIPRDAQIGRRFRIGHQHGISIDGLAVIGDDCLMRNNVTIGMGALSNTTNAPRLGNRVSIGTGAVILGGITVGDDVTIGPNAIVSTNVPAGSVVFLPPTRILQMGPKQAASPTEGDLADEPG